MSTDNDSKKGKEKGVWRTVSGRRIFIKNGQKLTDAMQESGKFQDKKKLARQKLASTIKKIADSKAEKTAKALINVKERLQKKKNERVFRNQLNQIQQGTFDKNSHLQLGETPKILMDKASLPKLPLMMPYSKAYLSINKSGVLEGNYHDLGVGALSALPTALHSPKYIFQHDNPKKIEVVVELKDKKGNNIFTSIEFETYGSIGGKNSPANVVVTAFAPRSKNYIETRKGKLVYEKKS